MKDERTLSEARQRLSLVVVILAGRPYLVRCLRVLEQQTAKPAEIIVPHDDRLTDVSALQAEFPGVRFVRLDAQRTFAELRSLGFRSATGDIIALTEDHCLPDPGWCRAILDLHEGPYAAVGGAVDKQGHDTTLNWAIYLSDFGRYMLPFPAGTAEYLTDCNVAYKREALDPIAPLWATEFHETTVNWALEGRGQKLLRSPEVVVRQQRSLELMYALRERYEFGRLFASTRVAGVRLPRRLVYAGLSFLLPGILVGRVLKNVAQKRRALRECVLALPMLVLLNTMWGWGEFAGYLTGRAARSLAELQGQRFSAATPQPIAHT